MSKHSRKLIGIGICLALLLAIARQSHWTAAGAPGDGLVAHWIFDPSRLRDRQLPDLTGKLDASLLGDPVFVTDPTPALELRGETDGIVVRPEVKDDADFLPRAALSVSAWVRLDRGTPLGGIVSLCQNHHDMQRGFLLGYTDSRFRFALATEGPDGNAPMALLTSKSRYERGKWSHVVATYDGQTTRLYVNGQLEAATGQAYGPVRYARSAPFLLGRYRDAYEDRLMQGALRTVALYSRALTAEEVADQFAAGKELTARPAISPPPHFVVAPYLQLPTRDTMTIRWETSTPGTSVVEYGTSVPPDQKVERKETATLHEIRLTGLRPNTKYSYRVATLLADGRTLTSELRTFQTAVDPESAFSFVLIGDTQKNPLMTGRIARLAWDRRPHFVVHLGDVVDNGPDKLEWEEELFQPCLELFGRVPIFPAIGNHEKDHAWYYRYFSLPPPEYYYQYRYGNADFFVLDSNKPLDRGSEQYRWLDQALGRSEATWKFAYHHHPAYSSDDNDYGDTWKGKEPSTLGDPNARHLVALYEKHGVDLAFNGHIHVYERSWPLRGGKVDRDRGVIYVTSGGGGGKLENFAPTPTWFKAQVRVDYHFCLVNIHQGWLEFKAFDQRGNLFDSFDLKK
jgi:hypothetical protein